MTEQGAANSPAVTLRREPWGRVLALLRLGRPIFLLPGVALHSLGVAIALAEGLPVNYSAWLWSQLAVTAIQSLTHYSNDYFDVACDQANTTPTRWSGGSRILQGGELPARAALYVSFGLSIVALVATWGLSRQPGGGAWMFVPLLGALALTWGYSAPPLRLHSRGVGEVVGGVLVGGITPLVGYFSQAGRLTAVPLLTVLPLALVNIAMLICVSIPDAAGDAASGKRTLVVRLGGAQVSRVHAALLALAYGMLPLLVWTGLPWQAAAASALGLPIAVWSSGRLLAGAWRDPLAFEGIAFRGATLLLIAALLQLLAYALWIRA